MAVASSLDTRRSASGVTLCTRDTWPALKYTSLGPPHQRLEFQCCVVVLGYHRDSNGPPGGSEAQPREAKHCPRSRRTASPSLAGEGQGYLKEPRSKSSKSEAQRQAAPTCSHVQPHYVSLPETACHQTLGLGQLRAHEKTPREKGWQTSGSISGDWGMGGRRDVEVGARGRRGETCSD